MPQTRSEKRVLEAHFELQFFISFRPGPGNLFSWYEARFHIKFAKIEAEQTL